MKIKLYIASLFLTFLFSTCSKEPFQPFEFGILEPGTNYFVHRENSFLVDSSFLENIVDIKEGQISLKNMDNLKVKPGDIIVSNFEMGKANSGFIYRIKSLNNTGLEVSSAEMTDAYSAYYIDSRANKSVLVERDNFFTTVLEWKNEIVPGTTVGFVGSFTPNISGNFSMNKESTYFVAQYDEARNVSPAFQLKLTNINLNLSISYTASFKVEAKKEFAAEPIPVIPIPGTPLVIMCIPKLELSGSLEGEFVTPPIQLNIAATDTVVFEYDGSAAVPLGVRTISAGNSVPQQSDWGITGKGSLGVKGGAEIIVAVPNAVDFAKAGCFVYSYANATASPNSPFSNPDPKVNFGAEVGVGTQFSAEINFFGGTTPVGLPLWFPTGSKVESSEFNSPLKNWNLVSISTCTRFDSAYYQFTNGNLTIFAGNSSPTRVLYDVYYNNTKINIAPIPYNTPVTLSVPNQNQLVSRLEVRDILNIGCFIFEDVVNPALVGVCTEKLVDPRDGNEYCTVNIGGKTWMAENLRYSSNNTLGRNYGNVAGGDNVLYGRLYTYDEVLGGEEAQPASNNNLGATTPNVKGICPVGWHLPSVSEFKNLDVATASTELKFPSTLLWEGATFKPIASGFNAVPAGCYFPWPDLPQNQYNFRGKRGFYWSSNYQYQTPFEASTQGGRSIYIYELRTGVGQESVLQTNGLLQGQILNKYEIKSIEEVGYSCRCVKN